MTPPAPHLPDFAGATTTAIVPALTWGVDSPVIPREVASASATVLLVLDSLGWEQLASRRDIAPNLTALDGGAVTTVAPSTTASALTSISTGVPPGEHGVVGYRFPAGGAVMNALRWTTVAGDHREVVPPASVQAIPALGGGTWTVVGGRQFRTSAFTEAYLGDHTYVGYEHPSSIVAEVRQAIDRGERCVYAYYDGLDHVAHIHGVSGTHFDLELQFCDWLVGALAAALPTGTSLTITADHGQIDAPQLVPVAGDVLELVRERSGEPRFRWLHARAGATEDLVAAARSAHAQHAWVHTRDELIDGGWFGPTVTDDARNRLGDVALIAHAPVGFEDPAERHADRLVGRHGSVTSAEMLVPALHVVC
ncbi:MAG: alkaline phosphatase family protein [Acidimicrobiales bacterium]